MIKIDKPIAEGCGFNPTKYSEAGCRYINTFSFFKQKDVDIYYKINLLCLERLTAILKEIFQNEISSSNDGKAFDYQYWTVAIDEIVQDETLLIVSPGGWLDKRISHLTGWDIVSLYARYHNCNFNPHSAPHRPCFLYFFT